LVSLLQALCPDVVTARAAAIAADEAGGVGELDTPLFVCTLAFPTQPTFLHIFEPRYRLMIRRAYESNRQFGMMMYNQAGQSQGDLGQVNFKQYGTMLQILNVHMFPDGRSLIETRGMYRFRVLAHGTLDGYTVGRVVRVEDVSLVEEERLEAQDIASASPDGAVPFSNLDGQAAMARHAENSDRPVNLNRLTTQQLLTVALDFITKMQAHSAPWLHQRILQSHGGPPDDPATFPYWFAAIIPIVDEEKYQLLLTSSVRERLKIIVGWIRRVENQRW
jgi:Lon protease-like protein